MWLRLPDDICVCILFLQQRGLVVPVKDIRNLSVMWPIPDQHPFYKSNVSI